jgi:hypothetical protein
MKYLSFENSGTDTTTNTMIQTGPASNPNMQSHRRLFKALALRSPPNPLAECPTTQTCRSNHRTQASPLHTNSLQTNPEKLKLSKTYPSR